MIRINQIKLSIFRVGRDRDKEYELVKASAARLLKLKPDALRKLKIVRRSIDARDKNDILFVYTVDLKLKDSVAGPGQENETAFVKALRNNNITISFESPVVIPRADLTGSTGGTDSSENAVSAENSECTRNIDSKESSGAHGLRPVIIGCGPCGLFAALAFAEAGLKPLIIERGSNVDERTKEVERFHESGRLDTDSNVQFGEGGAGTFSDGKLNTSIKGRQSYIHYVLKTFVRFGADEDILVDQKPHIGTDALKGIIKNIREYVISCGGEFRFNTRLDDIIIENGRVKAISLSSLRGQRGQELMPADTVILAAGHSARDTFEMLKSRGVRLEQKSFAMGVRVSHPQAMIDEALYGADRLSEKQEILGPASYKLTHRLKDGRSIYSFCMCPGGYIINSSSEPGMLAVNGMSMHDRDSATANSALIVNVNADDFGSDDVLAGMYLQRDIEKKAYSLTDGCIPYETFAEFKAREASPVGDTAFPVSFKGIAVPADVRSILPDFMASAIEEGMPAFARQIKGFDSDDTVIAGIESRTSSPVRIVRDERFESNIRGLYPAGEGAGYAGGITSAAADGVRLAVCLLGEE